MGSGELKAIHQLKRIELNDLKGIERQKEKSTAKYRTVSKWFTCQ